MTSVYEAVTNSKQDKCREKHMNYQDIWYNYSVIVMNIFLVRTISINAYYHPTCHLPMTRSILVKVRWVHFQGCQEPWRQFSILVEDMFSAQFRPCHFPDQFNGRTWWSWHFRLSMLPPIFLSTFLRGLISKGASGVSFWVKFFHRWASLASRATRGQSLLNIDRNIWLIVISITAATIME